MAKAVAPGDLADFLGQLTALGYCGANVTLPHKAKALAFCDRTTELAQRIGAVNTLWLEHGRLCGDNFDVSGFLSNLDEQTPGWDSNCERAVIFGSGGAARAILAGLAERKVSTATLLNRSVAHGQKLAEEAKDWGLEKISVESLNSDGRALAGANVLINTTPLGMYGQPPLETDLSYLADDAVVSDIVYTPLETPILKEAKKRGLRVCSGLGMLLHQAVPGFAHWFGVKPEVTNELRVLIEQDIERGSQ